MSIKDFEKYRHSLSYTLPTPEEVKKKPYGVVDKGVYGKYFKELKYYDDEDFNITKNALKNILESLYEKESSKEENFLNGLLRKIQVNDPEFYPTVQSLVQSRNFSKAFNAIKRRREGLYDIQKDFSTNIDKFANEWSKNQNKAFLTAFHNAITGGKGGIGGRDLTKIFNDNMLNKTFEEILEESRQIFMENARQTASYNMIENLDKVWDLINDYFRNTLQDKGLNITNNLKNYYDNIIVDKDKEWIKVKNRKKGQRYNKTVAQLAKKIAQDMILNGLSAELYLTLDGGAHTGQIKKQYKSYSGAQTTTGSIQSDVIELWNNEFEVDLDMTDSIKKILLEEKNDIYKKVEKLLDIYSENNFIIHYSSKDLNIMSTEKRATIRGTQSFDSRLEELERIAIEINGSKIEDLIFSIINTTKGLIFSNNSDIEKVKESIVAVCAAWMFEDYKETFRQIQSGITNNRLHCYFINGNYYLVSDILKMVLNQIEQTQKERIVTVSLSPGNKNVYGTVVNRGDTFGIPRWDAVRQESLLSGTIGIRMNTLVLEEIIKKI